MGASNKTDFLELGQYVSGDKPSFLGTYNSDMKAIDENAFELESKIKAEQEKSNEFTEQIKSLSDAQVSTVDTVKELVELTADVATDHTKIQKNETNITNLGDSVDNLISKTDTLKTGLDKNTTDVELVVKNLGNVGTRLNNHDTSIAEIQTVLQSFSNKKIQYFIGDLTNGTPPLHGITITDEMDIIFITNTPMGRETVTFNWHGTLTNSATTNVDSGEISKTFYNASNSTLLAETYRAQFKLNVSPQGQVSCVSSQGNYIVTYKANGINFPSMSNESFPIESINTFKCSAIFIQ